MYRETFMVFIKLIVLSLVLFSEGKPRWNPQEMRQKSTQSVEKLSKFLHSRTRRQTASKLTIRTNVYLVTKSSWFLAIENNGTVVGKDKPNNANTKLEMQAIGSSLVRLYGLKAKRYLAMNAKGRLYSTTQASNKDTIFRNTLRAVMFHTFSSATHFGKNNTWLFVAIRPNTGKPMKGSKAKSNKKSALFSVIQV